MLPCGDCLQSHFLEVPRKYIYAEDSIRLADLGKKTPLDLLFKARPDICSRFEHVTTHPTDSLLVLVSSVPIDFETLYRYNRRVIDISLTTLRKLNQLRTDLPG